MFRLSKDKKPEDDDYSLNDEVNPSWIGLAVFVAVVAAFAIIARFGWVLVVVLATIVVAVGGIVFIKKNRYDHPDESKQALIGLIAFIVFVVVLYVVVKWLLPDVNLGV